MSDVEARIEQWRAGLAGSESLRQSDVSELESHLREEMEHLKTAGLRDDEAFLVVRHRLGDSASLEAEFAKVNTSERLMNRLWWMAAGIFAYLTACCCSGMVAQASAWAIVLMGMGVRASAISFVLSEVVVFSGMIGFSVWLIIRHFREDGCRRTRLPTRRMVVAGLILMLVLPVSAFGVNFLSTWCLANSMSPESYSQLILARTPFVIVLGLLVPALPISVLAVVSSRARRRTSTV